VFLEVGWWGSQAHHEFSGLHSNLAWPLTITESRPVLFNYPEIHSRLLTTWVLSSVVLVCFGDLQPHGSFSMLGLSLLPQLCHQPLGFLFSNGISLNAS